MRLRDIDYASITVRKAIEEKFSPDNQLESLVVTAKDNTILVEDGQRFSEGTRDDILMALRKAETYAQFWDRLG